MAATSDNYTIVTSGITYTIASDYVKPSGAGETAHHQIVKVAYGADNTVRYVSNTSPLPVGLCGSWTQYNYLSGTGYNTIATSVLEVGVTLNVQGTENGKIGITVSSPLVVEGLDLDIRTLYGGAADGTTSGADYVAVQGISGGYPVGITTNTAIPVSVSSFSNMGVFGISGVTAIGVTFGDVSIRGITSATDSITVYGNGIESTVPTSIYGFAGSTSSIEAVYSTNNALNVNVSSITGVTVSATDLDIRNLDYTVDTVKIIGDGANDNQSKATVPTYINAAAGTVGTLTQVGGITGAGWCAAALNVYMVNSGITFTVSASATFSSNVGVTAEYGAALPVQGTNQAAYGVWVTGSTSGDPVTVKGYSGGFLPVELSNFDTQTNTINTSIQQVKTNTDFLIAAKQALYDSSVSVGAFDAPQSLSLHTLIKNAVNTQLQSLANTVSNGAVKVSVDSYPTQPSFMARTNTVGYTPKNLIEYNSSAGFTCATGVRIKVSRIATGTNASQNEFMCVISEADAALYGSTAGTASYTMYHGDEMFFEVDNINKIKVFYPPYSLGFAPHNTGSSISFSFYAS